MRGRLLPMALALVMLGPPLLFEPALAQAQEPAAVAQYDEVLGILNLKVPAGVRPVVQYLADPPRVVAQWPSDRAVIPQRADFAMGWVRRLHVENARGYTVVTLDLRESLPAGFRARVLPGGVQVVLDPASFATPNAPQIAFLQPAPRVTPMPVVPKEPEPRRFPSPEALQDPSTGQASFQNGLKPRRHPPGVGTVPPVDAAERPTRLNPRRPLRRAPRAGEPHGSLFTSRVLAGPELLVGQREVFQVGGSVTNTPWAPGLALSWEHWLDPRWGFAVGVRTQGYNIDDTSARPLFSVRHRRDEGELNGAIRARIPLAWGLETLWHAGGFVRGVTALTTHARLNNNVVGPSVAVDTTDYLSANWLALGGDLRGALAGRLVGPFSWFAFGEYRLTPFGSVFTRAVPSFLPLSAVRGGAEIQASYFGLAFAMGYSLGTEGSLGRTPENRLWQTGGLFHLRTGWAY